VGAVVGAGGIVGSAVGGGAVGLAVAGGSLVVGVIDGALHAQRAMPAVSSRPAINCFIGPKR